MDIRKADEESIETSSALSFPHVRICSRMWKSQDKYRSFNKEWLFTNENNVSDFLFR